MRSSQASRALDEHAGSRPRRSRRGSRAVGHVDGDADDALADGDDATYDELIDDAASGSIWLPTAALDALLGRDVEEIGYWIFVLDADEALLVVDALQRGFRRTDVPGHVRNRLTADVTLGLA